MNESIPNTRTRRRYVRIGDNLYRVRPLPYPQNLGSTGVYEIVARPPAGLKKLVAEFPLHREFYFDPKSQAGCLVPYHERIT